MGVAVISVYVSVFLCAYSMSFSVNAYSTVCICMHLCRVCVCVCWLDRISERELVVAVQGVRKSEKGGE